METETALVPVEAELVPSDAGVVPMDALRALDVLRARSEERAKTLMGKARSANTLRAYASDWRGFEEWCAKNGLSALPAHPETVFFYLTETSETRKLSTLRRRVAAISIRHRQEGYASPTREPVILDLLRGIAAEKADAGNVSAPKDALTGDAVRKILAGLDRKTLVGQRDAALLLIGFAGAFRRQELVALDVTDIKIEAAGVTLKIRRSKTDQQGAGRQVSIPRTKSADTCPVRALRAWLDAAGISEGPVFRSINRYGQVQPRRLTGQSVALLVKKHAEASGLDPEFFAGHSLRSGFATTAAANGATHSEIMAQTGHKTVGMVERYVRLGRRYEDSAAGKLGL